MRTQDVLRQKVREEVSELVFTFFQYKHEGRISSREPHSMTSRALLRVTSRFLSQILVITGQEETLEGSMCGGLGVVMVSWCILSCKPLRLFVSLTSHSVKWFKFVFNKKVRKKLCLAVD